jgi:magnesium transporter
MISVRVYRDGVAEEGAGDLDRAREVLAHDGGFVWLDAVDPGPDELDAFADAFGLHPVTVEDTRHRDQRPKVELFEGYAFLVVRALTKVDGRLEDQELHGFVGRRFLGTLRYGPAPCPVDTARSRWERQADALARDGGGFAAYVLVDEVVDGYLGLIEEMEDDADVLEDDVFSDRRAEDGGQDLQERIFLLKRDVVRLRRVAAPLRQGLDFLQEEPTLAGATLQPYFRDLTEHVLRVTELADNIRDLLTSLLEVRVSQVANHLNDIMKKLSAWAGIILVPTLIAGIYGMNFRQMPELHWAVGYPLALATMAVSAFVLYRMFKKRGWL